MKVIFKLQRYYQINNHLKPSSMNKFINLGLTLESKNNFFFKISSLVSTVKRVYCIVKRVKNQFTWIFGKERNGEPRKLYICSNLEISLGQHFKNSLQSVGKALPLVVDSATSNGFFCSLFFILWLHKLHILLCFSSWP